MRTFKGLNIVDAVDPGVRIGKMFIDGQWVAGSGSQWLEILSPATGERVGYIPLGTRADAARAVASANANRHRIARMSVWERSRLCMKIADCIDARREELARLLTLEQGKPYFAEALGEVTGAAIAFRNAAEQVKWLESSSFPVEDPNKRAISILQPKGVFSVITPWNFPMALPSIYYLGPGLASGNALVWAPAPTTSFCAIALVECLLEAGVPEGVVQLVLGEGTEVGDELVVHPQVQGIAFTGSSATGLTIARRGAGKSLLLELGGNGPTIVLDDAEIADAARRIAAGSFANAGQICTATERVLVHASVYDEMLERLVGEVGKVKLGPAFDEGVTMAALNNEENAAKVDAHLTEAAALGARILTGGGRAEGLPTRLYYQPSVIADVPPQSQLHIDETFGPVVPVLRFADDEELFRLAAMSTMGLSAALFTRDVSRAFRYAEAIRCGIVNVNEMSAYWEMHIPAGGASGSTSGHGRTGGRHTLQEMSDLKTITFNVGSPL